jgi:hypothetical protein
MAWVWLRELPEIVPLPPPRILLTGAGRGKAYPVVSQVIREHPVMLDIKLRRSIEQRRKPGRKLKRL